MAKVINTLTQAEMLQGAYDICGLESGAAKVCGRATVLEALRPTDVLSRAIMLHLDQLDAQRALTTTTLELEAECSLHERWWQAQTSPPDFPISDYQTRVSFRNAINEAARVELKKIGTEYQDSITELEKHGEELSRSFAERMLRGDVSKFVLGGENLQTLAGYLVQKCNGSNQAIHFASKDVVVPKVPLRDKQRYAAEVPRVATAKDWQALINNVMRFHLL